MNRNFLIPVIIALVATGCKNTTQQHITLTRKTTDSAVTVKTIAKPEDTDSAQLAVLVRKLYKWHETDSMKYDGFRPLKANPTDTAFTRIDLDENAKAIEELRQTGLFTEDFLNDYRKIAVRMDKELHDGSSLWADGELSTFGDDVDEWCGCQDFPVDDYWNIIKLTGIKINGNDADFRWTWGDGQSYKVKAKKENGNWKIAYLQGFDMAAYSWEWWKKHKNI